MFEQKYLRNNYFRKRWCSEKQLITTGRGREGKYIKEVDDH